MALSRGGGGNSALSKRDQQHSIEQSSSQHSPRSARGFCLLDTPDSYWKNGYCPYDLSAVQEPNVGVGVGKYVIERIDFGSAFFKNHFYGQGEILINFLYTLPSFAPVFTFIWRKEQCDRFCNSENRDMVFFVKSRNYTFKKYFLAPKSSSVLHVILFSFFIFAIIKVFPLNYQKS